MNTFQKPDKHGWLPVGEDSPPRALDVLVTYTGHDTVEAYVCIAWRDNDGQWYRAGGSIPLKDKVLGWQKMPQPMDFVIKEPADEITSYLHRMQSTCRHLAFSFEVDDKTAHGEQMRLYRKKADDIYSEEGRIEIDDDATISESDYGAYVQAWVWVGNEDLEEEVRQRLGIVTMEEDTP